MRILMITGQLPVPEAPGSMAPVVRQIGSIQAAGHEVDVLQVTGASRFKYLKAISHLPRAAASADIIHAHFGYSGWVAMSQRKPFVISFMGDDLLGAPDETGRPTLPSRAAVQINRLVARTAAAVIVKSPEMARIVAPVKAHVVPNGVDLSTFAPLDRQEARKLLGWRQDRLYVLFPGCPEIPRKGYGLARAACEQAARRLSGGSIAGSKIAPLEMAILWQVEPDQVPLYMNACDAMILTSFWEGSPNVVKEAMACNLPVVSVPVGDVRDLLDGVTGSSVASRDPDALAEALAGMLQAPTRTNGREALERKGLDQESVARRVISIYESVIAGKRI